MREFSKKYLDFLKGPLAGLNLTKITSEEEFYNKQIIDSLLPLESSDVFKECLAKCKKLVDVGFGGGFPIIPLAYKHDDCRFLGLEARRKKADAVTKIKDHFELSNVNLIHQRFEEVYFDSDVVVTFKAVGRIEDLLPMISCSGNSYVFFYKGPNVYELEDLSVVENEWELIEEKFIDIPGTEGRYLIGFKNKSVPRGTNRKKNKSLVKHLLSELI